MRWRERDGVRWLEAALPGARGVFTTRAGGLSAGPFASLNLGLLTGDAPANVYANRDRAASAAGIAGDRVLAGHQIHAVTVSTRSEAPDPNPFVTPGMGLEQADGQASVTAGLAPLVFVADCLPILLSGPGGVAAVHGGWRGLAGGIVAAGAEAVAARAAAIGPGIGPCCYEVGEEVLARFRDLGDGIADGRMLDLAAVARRKLEACGVGEISAAGLCTSCNPELFFSHRRDGGITGRQAGLIVAAGGVGGGRPAGVEATG